MESAPEGNAMGGSQDNFKTLHLLFLCCVSLSLLPHISCQVSQWDLHAQHGKTQAARCIFIWILITAQTELAGVMRTIYKTVSSFCMLSVSVKKIDGFIMLFHCVHVLGTVCQSATVRGNHSCDRWSCLRKLNPSCDS